MLDKSIHNQHILKEHYIPLTNLVCKLPLMLLVSKSGYNFAMIACLRRDDVPTTDPLGKSAKDFTVSLCLRATTKASRGSSRSVIAVKINPGGSVVGMSFKECTTKSYCFATRPTWIDMIQRDYYTHLVRARRISK